jgi:hypothetical protein
MNNEKIFAMEQKTTQKELDSSQTWGAAEFTVHFELRYLNFLTRTTSLIFKRSDEEGEYDFQILMNGSVTSMGHPSVCLFRFSSEKISWKEDASQQMIWTDIDPNMAMEQWTSLSITYDGSTLRSYVNGAINTETALETGAFKDSKTPVIIGYDEKTQMNAKECLIRDFVILRRSLSADEIKEIAKAELQSPIEGSNAGIDSITSESVLEKTGEDPNFLDPPKEYRPIQYSMNRTPDTDLLSSYGIGGVVLSAYHKDYLDTGYDWEKLKGDIRKVLEAGFSLWLYDEDLYPTGGAGGLTVKDHPEYEMRGMFETRMEGEGCCEFEMKLPDIGEKFVGAVLYPVKDGTLDYRAGQPVPHENGLIRGEGLSGSWVLCAYVQRVVRDNHATSIRKEYWAYGGLYPNLLDPDATDRYIAVTHQQYKDRLGEDFDRITAFYTGEPVLWTMNTFPEGVRPKNECLLPWTDSLMESFRKEHGYDLLPFLGEIFGNPNRESCQARYHLFKTIGTLLTGNFFARYSDWCERNGSGLSGHLLFEEELASHVPLYGNFMQCTSVFQLAGMDYYIYNHGVEYKENIMTMKYSLSARRHKGDYIAQGLYEPICSGCYFPKNRRLIRPSLSVMRANANQMIAGGVSVINNYGPYAVYGVEAYRKFTDYTSRLCYLLRGFRDDAKVAIYYNIETIQAQYRPNPYSAWAKIHNEPFDLYSDEHKNLGKILFEESFNFNFLDAYAFDDVVVENGTLRIAGYSYQVMIMPSMDILPLAVFEKLCQFEREGGLLIWLGDRPFMGNKTSENFKVAALSKQYKAFGAPENLLHILRKHLPERIKIDIVNPKDVFYSSFIRDDDGIRRHLIINRTHRPVQAGIKVKSEDPIVVYDPDQGRHAETQVSLTISLAPYSAVVVEEKNDQ